MLNFAFQTVHVYRKTLQKNVFIVIESEWNSDVKKSLFLVYHKNPYNFKMQKHKLCPSGISFVSNVF